MVNIEPVKVRQGNLQFSRLDCYLFGSSHTLLGTNDCDADIYIDLGLEFEDKSKELAHFLAIDSER